MLYPKIGIRPTIDGRWGGVRESLEEQTMAMARNAKALIEENLRYPDGTPVQCVIADSTIGGGAEAAACADKFSTQNVVATLTVTRCWCYGSETFDMDPLTIKAVWGFNGTERPGAVYLAAVMAAHRPKGPARLLHLRARRTRGHRHLRAPRRRRENPALRQVRRGCGLDEEQILRQRGRRGHGHRGQLLQTPDVPEVPGHPPRVGGHDRGRPAHHFGNLRPRGI